MMWLRLAGVAKLADALDLGSSVYDVGVQVPSPAPIVFYGLGFVWYFGYNLLCV